MKNERIQINNSSDYTSNFKEIYSNFSVQISNYIFKSVKNHQIAEELTQDLFYNLYRKKVEIKGDISSKKRYLFTCAKNIIKDYYKKKETKIICIETEFNIEIETRDMDEIYLELDNFYIEGNIVSIINDFFEIIPDHQNKEIFEKIILEGEKISTVCYKYGLSRYKVKKIISDIKRNIHKNIIKHHSKRKRLNK